MSESVYWGESTSTVAHDTGYTADRAREERRIANPCDTLKRIWDRVEMEPISLPDKAHSLREVAMALIAVVLSRKESQNGL